MQFKVKDRYARASIALHWLMAVLILGVYVLINLADVFDKGSVGRTVSREWHFMLGLTVLALVGVRLALRWVWPAPDIVPAPPAWQVKAGKAVHVLLYGLMVGMPILGWLVLSARGKVIPFYGFELPALLAANKELGHTLMEFHELGGNVGYLLIGGHAAAALVHHYWIKDNTLKRML